MNTHGAKREIRCEREVWFAHVKFWCRETVWTPDRITRAVALPLTFKTLTQEDECVMQEPFVAMADEQAQQFMDELWRVGFRPTEGTGSAGALAAVQKHLEDMRTLVFQKAQIVFENKSQ